MADATALIQNLILVPGRFGSPNLLSTPKDGIEGSEHHDVASSTQYRVGTICQLWHPGLVGQAGWSEFVYGIVGTASTAAYAEGALVHPLAITDMFTLTNAPDVPATEDTAFYAAVCLSAVTATYYAWFWSGGVCPCDLVTAFTATATYKTDDSVVVGGALELIDLASSDENGLGLGDGTKPMIATSTVGD